MNNNAKTEGVGTKPAMYFKYVAPQVRNKHLSLPILNFLRYIFVKKKKYTVLKSMNCSLYSKTKNI